MGAISSINFKKSNPIQTKHNDRELPPNYLLNKERGAECNRDSAEALKLKYQMINEAIEAYTNKTRQKFQAKSYEWSAVVNIKLETTMQDLEKLAEKLQEVYKIQCYQIAIHRDEGHKDDNGNEIINHHAHLEFITLDKQTGQNMWQRRHIGIKELREMQDLVAQTLQMQRGTDKRASGRQRIEPRKYAQMKEAERAAQRSLKQELETKHSQELAKSQNDANNYKSLLDSALNAYDSALDIDTTNLNYNSAIQTQKTEIAKLCEIKKAYESMRKEYIEVGCQSAQDYKDLSAERNKLLEQARQGEVTITDLNANIERLREALQEKKSKINALEADLSYEKQKNKDLLAQMQKMALNGDYEAFKEFIAFINETRTTNIIEIYKHLEFFGVRALRSSEILEPCDFLQEPQQNTESQNNNYTLKPRRPK